MVVTVAAAGGGGVVGGSGSGGTPFACFSDAFSLGTAAFLSASPPSASITTAATFCLFGKTASNGFAVLSSTCHSL